MCQTQTRPKCTILSQKIKTLTNVTHHCRNALELCDVWATASVATQFIGPLYTDQDFYFICRVIYTDSLVVNFDVALTFDGELLPGAVVKTVSSTSSLDVMFTSQDFTGQFGKTVRSPLCVGLPFSTIFVVD